MVIYLNEIALSNDLNVITAEINSYKQVAGQAIFEIGRRLKHVKENDLVHGEFGKWLKQIDMSNTQAHRFMKVYEEIPSSKLTHVGKISFRALYEIATMPEEDREKALNDDGSAKPVREIERIKKQLKQEQQAKQEAEQRAKQAESQAENAHKSEQAAIRRMEELENRDPEVIEKEIVKEVIPEHIKEQMREKEQIYQSTLKEYESMQQELELLRSKTADDGEKEQKEKEVKLLMLDASKSVLKTKIKIDEFLQEVAVTPYRRGAIASSSEGTKRKLQEGIDELKAFCNEMELALNGTIEHSK